MNKRKGISLIVLVITILVMIILAGVVVVSLQKNNPIEKSKEATLRTDIMSYLDELSLTIATRASQGNMEKLNATGTEIKGYIHSIKDTDIESFEIVENKLAYVGKSIEKEAIAAEMGVLAYGKGNVVGVNQTFGENGIEIDASVDKSQAIEIRPGSNPVKAWSFAALEIEAKPSLETNMDKTKFTQTNNGLPGQNTLIQAHNGKDKETEVFLGINLGINGIQIFEHANNWYPFKLNIERDLSGKHTYKVIINKKDVLLCMDGELIGKYTSDSGKVGFNFNKIGGGIYGGFKGTIYGIKVMQ